MSTFSIKKTITPTAQGVTLQPFKIQGRTAPIQKPPILFYLQPSGQARGNTDLSTLIQKNKKSCLSFELRFKALIEAGGCHVEGKKTRFKS